VEFTTVRSGWWKSPGLGKVVVGVAAGEQKGPEAKVAAMMRFGKRKEYCP